MHPTQSGTKRKFNPLLIIIGSYLSICNFFIKSSHFLGFLHCFLFLNVLVFVEVLFELMGLVCL